MGSEQLFIAFLPSTRLICDRYLVIHAPATLTSSD